MAENIEKLLRGELGSDGLTERASKFSFSGEKVVDEAALERLTSKRLA
jgi:hypothetical protein